MPCLRSLAGTEQNMILNAEKVHLYNHCSEYLKEHLILFSKQKSVEHSKFDTHLKANHKDPECPVLLHHLNSASKSLTMRHLIHEMSCQSHWNMFLKFILKSRNLAFLKVHRFDLKVHFLKKSEEDFFKPPPPPPGSLLATMVCCNSY